MPEEVRDDPSGEHWREGPGTRMSRTSDVYHPREQVEGRTEDIGPKRPGMEGARNLKENTILKYLIRNRHNMGAGRIREGRRARRKKKTQSR